MADLFVDATAQELAASDPPMILIHNDAAGWTEIRATPVPGDPAPTQPPSCFPAAVPGRTRSRPDSRWGYDFDPIVVSAQSESGLG